MAYYRDKEFIIKIGERLKEVRLEKGLSQEDVSHHTGFPLSQIGRIERGEINTSISHMAAYARTLGVHVQELFAIEFDYDPQNALRIKRG